MCAEAASASLKVKIGDISKQSKMQPPATTVPSSIRRPLPGQTHRRVGTPSFGSGAPVYPNGSTATQRSARVQLPNGTWTTVKVGGFQCSRSVTRPTRK
jgi:hypothetical protein